MAPRWPRHERTGLGVRISRRLSALTVALIAVTVCSAGAQGAPKPYAPVGLFFGAVEEGARIFTPVRLLPPGHPEAMGHDFPTVLQLHGSEFPMLLWLGERVGMHLWPTLERYPTEPASDWPYGDFRQPPDTALLRSAEVRRVSRPAPIPGLRAALFDDGAAVSFIIDTRGLSLAARGMTRPTSMGLEITRAQFLRGMASVAPPPGSGLIALVW